MKKRSKRGMALASTLIMMSIVMMMCTLMVTVTLYASQVTSLQTQNLEDKRALDEVGNIFVKNMDNPGVARTKIKEYMGDTSADDTAQGTLNNAEINAVVAAEDNLVTLTVTGKKGNQLMKITCEKSTDVRTGEVTTKLKSWAYAG